MSRINGMRRISKEQGVPFDEIVRKMATEGKSRLVVAGLLGCDYSWFLAAIRRRRLWGCFLPQQIRKGNVHPTPRWPRGMPRLSFRKPIEHNGHVWQPGEPTHHYLFSKGIR
jgi:hypothetical protein